MVHSVKSGTVKVEYGLTKKWHDLTKKKYLKKKIRFHHKKWCEKSRVANTFAVTVLRWKVLLFQIPQPMHSDIGSNGMNKANTSHTINGDKCSSSILENSLFSILASMPISLTRESYFSLLITTHLSIAHSSLVTCGEKGAAAAAWLHQPHWA